jgi:tetratricopeptide (TPR) repeat protein
MILGIIAVLLIVTYYFFPDLRGLILAIAAIVTILGFLLAIIKPSIEKKEILQEIREILKEKKDKDKKDKETEKKEIPQDKEPILSPVVTLCIGREKILSNLEDNLTHKNILLIKGIAGIGKTTIGRTLKERLEKKGYKTFWSHIGYNSYEGFLFELATYLKERGSKYAAYITQETTPEKKFKFAVQELCRYPTIVFLDDFQKLEDDSLFSVFRDYLKNSTVVIMSREKPTFLLEDYEPISYLDKNASITLLKQLKLKKSEEILEKIYEKTQGHPWSLECFVRLSHTYPVEKLFREIPDFREKQEEYINEQCWNTLNNKEKKFLMRVSVFTKLLDFDGLNMCSTHVSEVLLSLTENFYVIKRGKYYYIHDIIKEFAFSKLKKDEYLYCEAHKKAAEYYQKNKSAENLLLGYYHLKEAEEHKEGIKLVVNNIKYFWREGFWLEVREVLEESLGFFDDEWVVAGIYNSLGTIVEMLGEWDNALEYHKKDLEISEKLNDVSGIATAYGNIGLVYHDKGEWDKALEYYKKDLEISKRLNNETGMARAHGNIGVVYHDKGEWDNALEYYKKDLEISEKLNDVSGIATAHGNIGVVYLDKGEWDKALEYQKKRLEISKRLNNVSGMAIAYGNIGEVYYKKGKLNTALEYQKKRLEISKRLNNVSGMAIAYGNIGLVYLDKGEWDKALEYHKKDLEISEKLNNVSGMARAYCNIGAIYRDKGEWDKALEYHKKDLEISEKLNDVSGIATAYGNIGEAYYKKGRLNTALEYYKKSLEISKEIGDIYTIAYIYQNRGDISLAKKELNQALNWYRKSLKIFEKLGASYDVKITKDKISDALLHQ